VSSSEFLWFLVEAMLKYDAGCPWPAMEVGAHCAAVV
jgi:hypothetical protein